MITAGPTVEPIDGALYLQPFQRQDGVRHRARCPSPWRDVTLITGPVSIPAPSDVHVVHVNTALEMLQLAKRRSLPPISRCSPQPSPICVRRMRRTIS